MAQILYKMFDYGIRRLNALSAGLKSRLRGLTFAETPLSAISRLTWSPEASDARRCSKCLVKMVPRSARIWSSQPQIREAVYEIR